MIEAVSSTIQTQNNNFQNKKNMVRQEVANSYATRYMDSFVKHSVESIPMLTGMTLVWSLIDKSRGIPIQKALANNLKTFFLPVLIVTSAITAFLENRKTNKI